MAAVFCLLIVFCTSAKTSTQGRYAERTEKGHLNFKRPLCIPNQIEYCARLYIFVYTFKSEFIYLMHTRAALLSGVRNS
jgi:hypothetical protein